MASSPVAHTRRRYGRQVAVVLVPADSRPVGRLLPLETLEELHDYFAYPGRIPRKDRGRGVFCEQSLEDRPKRGRHVVEVAAASNSNERHVLAMKIEKMVYSKTKLNRKVVRVRRANKAREPTIGSGEAENRHEERVPFGAAHAG